MDTRYKNAQFVQVSQTMHLPLNSHLLTWSKPAPLRAPAKPGKWEKKILDAMDLFFTVLLLISGEEEQETISISHIL